MSTKTYITRYPGFYRIVVTKLEAGEWITRHYRCRKLETAQRFARGCSQ